MINMDAKDRGSIRKVCTDRERVYSNPGVDFFVTYSPVAKFATVKIIISVVA